MKRYYVFIILLFIIIPIFESHLIVDNWHKPTQRPTIYPIANPTFSPTTVAPSGPSYSPTLIPTTPTNEPTWKPTTPTMQPTTREPTAYDFKTMNRDGYIAVCVLVPYVVIGYTCIITFVMIGNGWCDSREIQIQIETEIGTEINIDTNYDIKTNTEIETETEIDFDIEFSTVIESEIDFNIVSDIN